MKSKQTKIFCLVYFSFCIDIFVHFTMFMCSVRFPEDENWFHSFHIVGFICVFEFIRVYHFSKFYEHWRAKTVIVPMKIHIKYNFLFSLFYRLSIWSPSTLISKSIENWYVVKFFKLILPFGISEGIWKFSGLEYILRRLCDNFSKASHILVGFVEDVREYAVVGAKLEIRKKKRVWE